MEGNRVVEGEVVDVPAKVAVPEVGTEMPVISKERWEEMQRRRAEGQSVSQIARVTGLDRKTVRSCLRKTEWMPYCRMPVAETLLSTHRAWYWRFDLFGGVKVMASKGQRRRQWGEADRAVARQRVVDGGVLPRA